MTRFPHDQFAKDFLESLLSPLGEVQTSLKVSGEVREMDVYFTPNPNGKITSDLGLLAQCAETATVFEPFRSSVKLPQIRGCMSKLFDLHNYLIRETKKHKQPEPKEEKLPKLWILTPTLSVDLLESLRAKSEIESWGEGVYLLSPVLKTGIIVIHQLPQTPASLWFRLLGKGKVQSQAIDEVAALPPDNPYRQNALDLLGNLKVILEARAIIEPEEQSLIMQLSPLYLEKIHAAEQVGRQDGKQALILRLLSKRVGTVSSEVETRVKALSLAMLEELFDAALDFTQMNDLMMWLDGHQ
jgi:Domain of unknown function (DUF4351)